MPPPPPPPPIQLPYTAAVIDEALRLYPPGASTTRESRGGLALGGRAVPDGTTVVVATYAIQRDPAYWPKADQFLPERWLKVGAAGGRSAVRAALGPELRGIGRQDFLGASAHRRPLPLPAHGRRATRSSHPPTPMPTCRLAR
jgi:hypothetical protein